MPDSDLYELISGNLPLKDALEAFITAKKTEGRAAKTITFYVMEIGYFVQYAAENNMTNVQSITVDTLRQYFIHKGETRNQGGVHAAFRAVRALFRWYEDEVEPDNWKNPIRKVKVQPAKVQALPGVSMADYDRIIEACKKGTTAARDQALFRCLLDSCARASEFVQINIGDVNLISGDVLIRSGKGGNMRYVEFGRETRRKLRAYLKTRTDLVEHAPLFLNRRGDRISFTGLDALLRFRCGQAGIDKPGLHDIRRAGALELLRNGADVAYISRYLGHHSIEVTMRYLAITPDDMREMHRKASPVDFSLKRG